MSTTLTIRLDKELDETLSQLAAEQKRSKSDLVREMLRRQAAVADLHLLREELVPQAERAGYLSEDDFFRDVS
ncbi:MAG: CopG family transcriptional regulator [Pseudomonadota bacterium]|nr:MAG: CopG family transcriptional regulator [Pseudomonadota bacterium]